MKVCEIFGPTLQCEGEYTGFVAIFVRLWGCVPPFCKFCDTPYSWKKSFKPKDTPFVIMNVDEIFEKITNIVSSMNGVIPRIIITGGEPFAQPEIYDLIDKIDDSYYVDIETSGKAYIDNTRINTAYVTMSPKTYDKKTYLIDKKNNIRYMDYYKFVIGDEIDVQMALNFIRDYKLNKNDCFFMPLGATREEQIKNLPFVFDECIKYGIRLSARIQVLTYDTKRGV